MRLAVAGVCCVLICCSASALGPHEILVLVNVNSRDSELVATEFCRLRCVPTNNVIRLSLPQSWGEAPATISN
ncbi:MAG: hypothetical protein N2255_02775 [Kiritimatiellae bacterium]|nr:hypothetical protein [Kiritimatiellia bacterium]